ncbi:MAG: beta-galactosidase [Chloroflexales bacterium]|nr:beta-galactosidase [Chloroflexales bacterium]
MLRSPLLLLLLIPAFLCMLGFGAQNTPNNAPRNTATTAKSKAAQSIDYFPIGVIEDANIVRGDNSDFERTIQNLQARGFDSMFMVNNFAERDASLLNLTDQYDFNMYMMPAGDWNQTWWPASIPKNLPAARNAAQPVVRAWSGHPSLKGYVLKDEPYRAHIPKLQLMARTLRELDPATPLLASLVGLDRVEPIYTAVGLDVMAIDAYPFGRNNPPCDTRMTGLGYHHIDFVPYIRAVSQKRPAGAPLWTILQTHAFSNSNFSLRQPRPSEVRMQQWLALGEGATGVFWFVYSTQQSWIGLEDNNDLLDEVTMQTYRLRPLRKLLLKLQKTDDRFTVAGQKKPYISTLSSRDGQRMFALAVNRDCQQAQQLTINARHLQGVLRDVETEQLYSLGEAITFQPGDGKLLELFAQPSQ